MPQLSANQVYVDQHGVPFTMHPATSAQALARGQYEFMPLPKGSIMPADVQSMSNFSSPPGTERGADGRHPRLRTVRHHRNGSIETVKTVDSMSEHASFYPARTVSPRRAMTASKANAASDGRTASGTSQVTAIHTPPTVPSSSQATTSPAGLYTTEHAAREAEQAKELALQAQRGHIVHGEMITSLQSITKAHDGRIENVEGSLMGLWSTMQQMQLTQATQAQQMQLQHAHQMQLQTIHTPVMAQQSQFAGGHFTYPGAYNGPGHTVQGPSIPHDTRPIAAGMNMTTPNPEDDVFGVINQSTPARFDQKDYSELVHSVSVKIEAVVRSYLIAPLNLRSKESKVVHLINNAAAHLDHRGMAFTMLDNPSMRIPLTVGMMNRWLVEEIYAHPVLVHHPNKQMVVKFMSAWADELRVQASPLTANNYPNRDALAENRARLARIITQLPGFWRWQGELSNQMTENLISDIFPLIRPDLMAQARNDIYKAVNEAVKTVLRMRQDAKVFDTAFYRYGTRWDHKGMVQRNEEMMGLPCDENPPIFVVRCTMAPWIGEKTFTGGKFSMRTLQKGEVTLCDRKTHLR